MRMALTNRQVRWVGQPSQQVSVRLLTRVAWVTLLLVGGGCETSGPGEVGSAASSGPATDDVAQVGEAATSSGAATQGNQFSLDDDLGFGGPNASGTATKSTSGSSGSPSAPLEQPPNIAAKIPPEVLDAPTRSVEEQYSDKSPKRRFQAKQLPSGSYLYHGMYAEYRSDGSVLKTGNYEYGKKVGEWKFFGRQGKLLKQGEYDEDKPVGQWTMNRPDGTLDRIEVYDQDGEPDGEWKAYQSDGQTLMWARSFKAGARHGTWVNYTNGQKTVEVTFKEGKQDGPTRLWNAQGKLMAEGNFVDGQRQGKFTSWNEDGSVKLEETYDHGSRVSEK